MERQNKILKEKNKKFVKENTEMRECLKIIYDSKELDKKTLNWIKDILERKEKGKLEKRDKYEYISRD